jgi:CheY-like chemotaxis protein
MLRTLVSRNVTIDLQLGQDPPVIVGDAGQVQQIVMNFITNASEAIGDKSGVVTLSTGIMECDETYLSQSRVDEKPKPGQYAWLEVTDTGCGMDAETLQRLFEPFFTTKFTGRGLGMSAVQGIIKGHNGALLVQSWKGTGTTFRVLLPAAATCASADKTVIGEAESADHDHKVPMSGTILIVDDEEAVRNLCASAVARLGFETLLAGDGVEAVQILSTRPDRIVCVILDLTMPRMNGVETFEAMIDIKPDIKVILCSGYAEQQATQSFTRRSPAGFVHKPFRLAALRAELERVLRNGDSGAPVHRPSENQVPAGHI